MSTWEFFPVTMPRTSDHPTPTSACRNAKRISRRSWTGSIMKLPPRMTITHPERSAPSQCNRRQGQSPKLAPSKRRRTVPKPSNEAAQTMSLTKKPVPT